MQSGQWVVLRQRGQPAAALTQVKAAGIVDSADAVRPDRLTRLTLDL